MSSAVAQHYPPERLWTDKVLPEDIGNIAWSRAVDCQVAGTPGGAGTLWGLMAGLSYTPGDESEANIVSQGRVSATGAWIDLEDILGAFAGEIESVIAPVIIFPVSQVRFGIYRTGGSPSGAGKVTLDVFKADNVIFEF